MNIKKKQGIAMIELIFALVIIGIVLMSAPMLIFQASQSNTVAIQQEAISAISAHTNILMSKHWDEADANLSAGVAPILKTDSISSLEINSTTNTRDGLYSQSSRLTLYNSATLPASIIESEGDDRDDIDDYHNTDNNVSVYANQSTNSQKGDYVDVNLNIHTDIRYVKDEPTIFDVNSTVNAIKYNNTATPNTSNIKFIHVVLTSNSGIKELNKTITLESFSCNIGTTTINGKEYK